MMFECKVASSQTLKNLIEAISSLLEDGELIVKPNGIELRAIDPSRIAMVDLYISKNVFDSYACDGEPKLKINFYDLTRIVSRAGSTEEISLKLLDNSNKLQIKIKGRTTKTFNLPLLEEVGCETMNKSGISSDVEIVMKSDVFSQAVKDANIVSDSVNLKVTKEGDFMMEAIGYRGDLIIDFDKTQIKNDSNDSVLSKYSLGFLVKMLRAGIISENVTIRFSKDKPIELEFLIQGDEKFGRIKYLLAPQVEEDVSETDTDNEEEEISETDTDNGVGDDSNDSE